MNTRQSAVFDNLDAAKNAVDDLVAAGVPNSAINYAARDGDTADGDISATEIIDSDAKVDKDEVLGGVLTGGAAGALLGIVALALPVVGPAVAAGVAASIPAVAGTGALIGGSIGGITEALKHNDFDEHEIGYYEEHIGRGGVLLTVAADSGANADEVNEILARNGGHRPSAPAMTNSDAALA